MTSSSRAGTANGSTTIPTMHSSRE
jgi:hypothetical protein